MVKVVVVALLVKKLVLPPPQVVVAKTPVELTLTQGLPVDPSFGI